MKLILSLLLLLISFQAFSQQESESEYWARWDKNYPEVNISEILEFEKYYADSIERNPEIPPLYARKDGYRFAARYKGKVRKLNPEVAASMKQVFSLFIGDPAQLDKLVESEVLFSIGTTEVWMPVQKQILKALKEEVKTGDTLILYCLFLNQHTQDNKLFNTFLISEFVKQ